MIKLKKVKTKCKEHLKKAKTIGNFEKGNMINDKVFDPIKHRSFIEKQQNAYMDAINTSNSVEEIENIIREIKSTYLGDEYETYLFVKQIRISVYGEDKYYQEYFNSEEEQKLEDTYTKKYTLNPELVIIDVTVNESN